MKETRILTVFGSTSDKGVYEPLAQDLDRVFPTDNRVISAHRNPRELRELVEKDIYGIYVAGAGLAAHLPGVVASLTSRPVVGLPVAAAFAGLDSLFSILQMPFGVPVLTFGPSQARGIASFLSKAHGLENRRDVCVIARDKAQDELARLKAKSHELHYNLHLLEEKVDPSRATINMVSKPEHILEGPVINVPLLEREKMKDAGEGPRVAMEVFRWVDFGGGAWMGVNNTRNALLWWDKWFSISGQ